MKKNKGKIALGVGAAGLGATGAAAYYKGFLKREPGSWKRDTTTESQDGSKPTDPRGWGGLAPKEKRKNMGVFGY
jgi:hypothetical protein